MPRFPSPLSAVKSIAEGSIAEGSIAEGSVAPEPMPPSEKDESSLEKDGWYGSDKSEIGRRRIYYEEEDEEEEEEAERRRHRHHNTEKEDDLKEDDLKEDDLKEDDLKEDDIDDELDSDDRGGDEVTVPQESYSTRSRPNILKDESPLTNVLNVLCRACSKLNLSPEKFIVHGKHGVPTAPYMFDCTGLKSTELGYLDDIYSRRLECPFCMLVYKSTHQRDRGGIGHDGLDKSGGRVLCNLDWQLDGRNGNNPTRILNQGHGGQRHSQALTRRARLYSKKGAFPDTFVVLLRTLALKLRSPTFLGRIVSQQYINPDLLRRWIDTCVSCHGLACQTLHNAELAPNGLHTDVIRFIDVNAMCLATAPFESTKYVALSYVWGNAELARQVRLLKDNTDHLHSAGGFDDIFDTLPRTIQDSIHLAKSLGFRYLWVDSLCVQQDDRLDQARLIGMMDRIYGSSVLTICVASGAHANAGLPGIRQPRELSQDLGRCAGVYLLIVRLVEDRINDTAWNTRAWTFQERLLSNRCLVFADDRVFFQCRQATWSEEIDCEARVPNWNLDMVRSPLAVFKENPLRRYATCVQLYSCRYLSMSSDKLNAFEGIGNVLATPLKAIFHYGLPNSFFDWALLWDISLPIPYYRIDEFPSWSWCGWLAGVEWRLSTTANILNNIHEWLCEHTWIVWFIGTMDCSYELIWDFAPGKEKSTRWDGYTADNDQTPYGRSRTSEMALDVSNYETVPTCPPITGCLHFWTYSAMFSLTRTSMSNATFKSTLNPGLHRFGIEDAKGDWCGTIILNEDFFKDVGSQFEFIAISEAKDFELEEFDSWTYYIPEEREQAEWYLYYALMIRWKKEDRWGGKEIAERLGLAKIYKMAFHSASFEPGQIWKEIALR